MYFNQKVSTRVSTLKNVNYCFKKFSPTCCNSKGHKCHWSDCYVRYQVSPHWNKSIHCLLIYSGTKVFSSSLSSARRCFNSSILNTHMSGRFCKICLQEAQATMWASEGRLASDWISFSTIVFKHWWAAFKSLSNCCPSVCIAKWLQMFLNSILSWKEEQTQTSN